MADRSQGWETVEEFFLKLIRGEGRGLWPGLLRAGLWLASGPYGWVVRLRNLGYDRGWLRRECSPVPVVSIGNLTVGGTGKTPCVEHVARRYREMDLRVAILSRGYGRQAGRNDEALLLEENLPDVPHLQGADRAALARIAVEELESEVLILDDGFQHRRLARGLDVVLLDATNPWGHGYLLPRGLLREPPSSLRRAGVVMLTRCDQVEPANLARLLEQVQQIAPAVPVVQSRHRPVELVNSEGQTRPLADLANRDVILFCGLGNPEGFQQTMLDLGARVQDLRVFPDHHPYTRSDVEKLRGWARQHATECVVVTTQKDLVKIRLARLGDREMWALRIQLDVTAGQDVLDRKLKEVLG